MPPNETDEFPRVTVGITSYCAEDTVARSIASARALDWPNMEIVIVDDCSSDRTVDIIKQAAGDDDRVRFFRHESNQGLAGSYNSIISNAVGEFIAFIDDDDECDPSRLRKQWQRVTAYEKEHDTKLIFCYANRDVVTVDGEVRPSGVKAIGRIAPEPSGAPVADYVLWQNWAPGYVWGEFGSCILFARRSTFLEVGPFDTQFRRNAEWDMAVRLAFMGGHFIAVDEPLLRQYVTMGHDKVTPVRLASAVALRRKYKDYLASRRLYWAALATTYARYCASNQMPWRSRAYLALACLANPYRIMPSIARNISRKRQAHR